MRLNLSPFRFAGLVGTLVLSIGLAGAAVAGAEEGTAGTIPVAPPGLPPVFSSAWHSPVFSPDLGDVPTRAKSRTGRFAPATVEFAGDTVIVNAGETVIADVPAYLWRDGCGPTAVGMVLGYWDSHGWGDLFAGSAVTQTLEVDQAIASRGSAGTPRHYEDYSLPMDAATPAVVADRSAAPSGDEHPSDCVADFMQTSWSSLGLRYGGSYSSRIGPAFTSFIKSRYPDASPAASTYSGSNLTWDIVKQEIDGGRPMVFLVDSDKDGRTDHFVPVIGWRETGGVPEYACWDTWSASQIRWQQFRAMSADYGWGVWGGFKLDPGVDPGPEPTPTPSPSPTNPPADVVPPVTTVGGPDGLWHDTPVQLTFTATDEGTGVALTEYAIDGGAWRAGTSAMLRVGRHKFLLSGVHVVTCRSTDLAGNVEAPRDYTVGLDVIDPTTVAGTPVKSGASMILTLTASDSHSGVAATCYTIDGGDPLTGTTVTVKGSGTHDVVYWSTDAAGNVEAAKSTPVTVK